MVTGLAAHPANLSPPHLPPLIDGNCQSPCPGHWVTTSPSHLPAMIPGSPQGPLQSSTRSPVTAQYGSSMSQRAFRPQAPLATVAHIRSVLPKARLKCALLEKEKGLGQRTRRHFIIFHHRRRSLSDRGAQLMLLAHWNSRMSDRASHLKLKMEAQCEPQVKCCCALHSAAMERGLN